MEHQAVALNRVKVKKSFELRPYSFLYPFDMSNGDGIAFVKLSSVCLCCFVQVFVWISNEGKAFFLKVMEDELAALAELRMKEESATELSVGLFDTKRNLRVQKGRETQERERREREKSEVKMDLSASIGFLYQARAGSAQARRDFFTETAVTPKRKVEKSFPRWEINRHAEG